MISKTQRKLLNLIKNQKLISSAALSRLAKMHRSSVSPHINILLDKKYIREAGIGKSTNKGGKPPVLLELNPNKGYIIGLHLSYNEIKSSLVNFKNEIVEHSRYEPAANLTERNLIHEIKFAVDRVLANHKLNKEQILGVGIGLPGVVNSQEGVVYKSTSFELRDYPLKDKLNKEIELPVVAMNDVNTAILGEKWYTIDLSGKKYKNLLFMSLTKEFFGWGFGIVIDGKLYEGHNYIAGEIYKLFPSLDMLLSDLPEEQARNVTRFDVETLKKYYGVNNPAIEHLVNKVVEISSLELVDVIDLLDPDLVVIGGGISRAEEEFTRPLISRVNEMLKNNYGGRIDLKIIPSRLKEHAISLGAGVLILHEYMGSY